MSLHPTATASLKQSRLVTASPIFYGWIVVAAATLGMAMTIPGQTAGLSLFIDSFIADLGLSRSGISLAYTIATVTASLSLPLIGRGIDRYGPRRGVIAIALLFGLSCFWMGSVAGPVTLFIGFVLLRAMGPGALSLVNLHAVNIWFIRRRGTAIGWMGVGLALATAVFPLFIEELLLEIGWRQAFFVLGLGMLAILLPLGAALFREQPEHFGLEPDGRTRDGGGEPAPEATATLREARRTRIFWLLTLGGVCVGALGTGLLFHHFSILEHNGLGRAAAAVLFVPLGFATAASNLGTGVLVDRFEPRCLLGVMLLLFAAMLAALPFVTTPAAVWVYGSLFGLVQGMQGSILGSAYAHYFGRAHIGAIKGFTKTLMVGGTSIGPLAYAGGLALTGGYSTFLVGSALLPLALGTTALLSRTDAPEAGTGPAVG